MSAGDGRVAQEGYVGVVGGNGLDAADLVGAVAEKTGRLIASLSVY